MSLRSKSWLVEFRRLPANDALWWLPAHAAHQLFREFEEKAQPAKRRLIAAALGGRKGLAALVTDYALAWDVLLRLTRAFRLTALGAQVILRGSPEFRVAQQARVDIGLPPAAADPHQKSEQTCLALLGTDRARRRTAPEEHVVADILRRRWLHRRPAHQALESATDVRRHALWRFCESSSAAASATRDQPFDKAESDLWDQTCASFRRERWITVQRASDFCVTIVATI